MYCFRPCKLTNQKPWGPFSCQIIQSCLIQNQYMNMIWRKLFLFLCKILLRFINISTKQRHTILSNNKKQNAKNLKIIFHHTTWQTGRTCTMDFTLKEKIHTPMSQTQIDWKDVQMCKSVLAWMEQKVQKKTNQCESLVKGDKTLLTGWLSHYAKSVINAFSSE